MRSLLKTLAYIFLIIGFCIAGSTMSNAQSDNLVRNRLKRIALGQTDEVRTELPDLLSEFPNDPGVRLLHAVLVEDAALALPMFEKIVEEYPQSEWADDAQWRVVQIYALRNDTAKAWQTLQEYRKQYPDSEFLLFASELVKNAVGRVPPSRKASVYESKSAADKSVAAQGSARQTPKKTNAAKPAVDKAPAEKAPAEKAPAEKAPAEKAPAEKASPEKTVGEKTAVKEKDAADRYALQVGLYSTRQSAEAEVEKFRSARMRTEIIEKTVDSEKKYAVIIGSYSTHEGAEKAKETVEKYCNCTPFIIER